MRKIKVIYSASLIDVDSDVQNWLAGNRDINIISVNGTGIENRDCVTYILYEEKGQFSLNS
jgi:hypothetical protein